MGASKLHLLKRGNNEAQYRFLGSCLISAFFHWINVCLRQTSLSQILKQLNERFEALEVARRETEIGWTRLEREFLEFRADLPLHYVRREDYLRGQAIIEAKLDAVYSKIELIQHGNY